MKLLHEHKQRKQESIKLVQLMFSHNFIHCTSHCFSTFQIKVDTVTRKQIAFVRFLMKFKEGQPRVLSTAFNRWILQRLQLLFKTEHTITLGRFSGPLMAEYKLLSLSTTTDGSSPGSLQFDKLLPPTANMTFLYTERVSSSR